MWSEKNKPELEKFWNVRWSVGVGAILEGTLLLYNNNIRNQQTNKKKGRNPNITHQPNIQ